VFVVCSVGSGLCDELIARPEGSDRLRVCLCVCVCVYVCVGASKIKNEALQGRYGLSGYRKKLIISNFSENPLV